MANNCLYCLQISRHKSKNLPYQELTLNGYQVARLIESNSLVTAPELVEAHSKLTSYELSAGRWCKECGTRID